MFNWIHTTEAHPETAQMMIINPLSGQGMVTHKRICRLMELAQTGQAQ